MILISQNRGMKFHWSILWGKLDE